MIDEFLLYSSILAMIAVWSYIQSLILDQLSKYLFVRLIVLSLLFIKKHVPTILRIQVARVEGVPSYVVLMSKVVASICLVWCFLLLLYNFHRLVCFTNCA